jgi:hypothetical protein
VEDENEVEMKKKMVEGKKNEVEMKKKMVEGKNKRCGKPRKDG